MAQNDLDLLPLSPEVYARATGGYLAVSPEGSSLRIAVLGETKEEAIREYGRRLERWAEILDYQPGPGQSTLG